MSGPAFDSQAVDLVASVQRLPYVWPAPALASSAREVRAGSCASKHALPAEELDRLGLVSLPLLVVGRLVPRELDSDPAFAPARHLLEVHECFTLMTPWAGPLRVDVTWDPPLIRRGLPGTLDWSGDSDMLLAVAPVDPGWSVPRHQLREAEEALRARLYGPGERHLRDEVLAALSGRFAAWRSGY